MFVVGHFALHSRYVVLVPVHQSLLDLVLLVDLREGHLAIDPPLPFDVRLDFLDPSYIAFDVNGHVLAEMRSATSPSDEGFPVLLLDEVSP